MLSPITKEIENFSVRFRPLPATKAFTLAKRVGTLVLPLVKSIDLSKLSEDVNLNSIIDGIIEMLYALDNIAPGTANDDTLLYGVEVKFYNMEVEVSDKLESRHPGLFIIGDGSGITHSLSHASASGVHVARDITK